MFMCARICLLWVLVALDLSMQTLRCGVQNLVPLPDIKPKPSYWEQKSQSLDQQGSLPETFEMVILQQSERFGRTINKASF